MKVAIIAIAKNENLYINEWLEYHFKLGFDNIIVCDNDDELILKDVVKDKRVIIEDYTKIKNVQQIAYQQTFRKYKCQYDWILLIDIDEFLVLEKDRNVNEFLSRFNKDVECIKLCYKHFSDNEELDVIDGNYNVFDRFKTEIKFKNDDMLKQFIKTTISDSLIDYIRQHNIWRDVVTVDSLNNSCSATDKYLRRIVHEIAWINHYRTKTIGEFIRQKYFRGGPNNNGPKYKNLMYFWETNKKTKEKVDYAEKLIAEYEQKIATSNDMAIN